jgi:hypothetical protein
VSCIVRLIDVRKLLDLECFVVTDSDYSVRLLYFVRISLEILDREVGGLDCLN